MMPLSVQNFVTAFFVKQVCAPRLGFLPGEGRSPLLLRQQQQQVSGPSSNQLQSKLVGEKQNVCVKSYGALHVHSKHPLVG